MSWKSRIGIEDSDSIIFTKEIDTHLMEIGFKKGLTQPDITPSIEDLIEQGICLHIDEPCLKLDGFINGNEANGTQTVWLNQHIAYVLKKDQRDCYLGYDYYEFTWEEKESIGSIESILEKIIE